MGIKSAIIVFSSTILVLFGVLSVTLMKTTDLLEVESTRLNRASEGVSVAKEFKLLLLDHNKNLFLGSLHKDPSRMAVSHEQVLRLNKLIEKAEALSAHREEKELILADVKEKISDYLKVREKLQDSSLSATERFDISRRYIDAAELEIDRLVVANEKQKQAILSNVSATSKLASQSAITLLSISCAILLGIILGGIFLVTIPLTVVGKVISDYASGDTSRRAKIKGLNEIQVVADNFNSMADKLDETRSDQLRFIASIAHDLRNPISSMAMATELLLSEGKDLNRDLTKVLARQLKNLDRLVGDLLDTTRIESGNLELKTSVEDVAAIIKDAVKLHQQSSSVHSFKIETGNDPLLCNFDRDRISQVMNNLISNAIKYSPNGGLITVKAWKDKKRIFITVSDQGIGIDPEDMKGIFKPFQRTKSTKATIPGIGLGLSTSRRILEAHHGSLWVESQPGKGSTFFIELPAYTEEPRVSGDQVRGRDLTM